MRLASLLLRICNNDVEDRDVAIDVITGRKHEKPCQLEKYPDPDHDVRNGLIQSIERESKKKSVIMMTDGRTMNSLITSLDNQWQR